MILSGISMLTRDQARNDAYTAFKSGDFDRAQWFAQQVLEQGEEAGMLKLLGAIFAGRMNWPESLVHYLAAIEVDPQDAEAWNNAGVVWQKAGKLDDARRFVNRAIVLDPNYAQAFFNLGNLAGLQGEPDVAAAAYQRSIDLNPDHLPSYTNLGRLLQASGDLDRAAGLYREVIQRSTNLGKPIAADTYVNLGNALQLMGSLEAAKLQYEKAIKQYPYDARLPHNLGLLYRQLGDRETAKVYYLLALKLDGTAAATHHQLGLLLQAEGQTDLAIAHLQQALSYAETDAAAWQTLGRLWCMKDDWGSGAGCLERAIALEPEFAEAHWDLGRVLLKLGQWDRGWQECEWRWQAQTYLAQQLPRHRKIDRWDGREIKGQKLLVWTEGTADQVKRLAPFLAQIKGATIVVECEPDLQVFFQTMPVVSQVIARGEKVPMVDWQMPIGSVVALTRSEPLEEGPMGEFWALNDMIEYP